MGTGTTVRTDVIVTGLAAAARRAARRTNVVPTSCMTVSVSTDADCVCDGKVGRGLRLFVCGRVDRNVPKFDPRSTGMDTGRSAWLNN